MSRVIYFKVKYMKTKYLTSLHHFVIFLVFRVTIRYDRKV